MAKSFPTTFRKLVVKQLTPKFREAVETVTVPMLQPGPKEVLIKARYVGINASDVNMAAGRYFAAKPPPYDIGFEGMGEIMQVGSEVSKIKVGQPAAYFPTSHCCFAEYVCLTETEVIPLPEMKAEYLPVFVSGTTAAIGLDKAGYIKTGETVFITAAAGGTGQIAVQWAKNVGCHVIGTCSSAQKVDFLKSIGCDRPINYKEESISEVLKKEYPKGIDVVWETIGGEMFDLLVKHLAIKGRLIVVGGITGYKTDTPIPLVKVEDLPSKLLGMSSSITGFLLLHYKDDLPAYVAKLIELIQKQKLKSNVDPGKNTDKEFLGINDISRAVEYLHSGKNIGKVIVPI